MMEIKMIRNLVCVLLFVYLSSASQLVQRQSNKIKDARGDLLQQDMFDRQLSRKQMPRKDTISSFLGELKDTAIVKKLLTTKKTSATDSNEPSSLYGNQYWGRKKQATGLEQSQFGKEYWGRKKEGESQRSVTDADRPNSFGKEYWGRKKEAESQTSVADWDDASSETYKGQYGSKFVKRDEATSEKEKRKDDISSRKQWDKYWNGLKRYQDTKTEERKNDDQIAAEELWKKYFELKDDLEGNTESGNQRRAPLHK